MPKSGQFSFTSLAKGIGRFWQNPPIDQNGSSVFLVDFKTMPDSGVLLWRDHLCDSFSAIEPSNRPFRALSQDGSFPLLTMLDMGATEVPEVTVDTKNTRIVKKRERKEKRRAWR